MIMRGDYVIIKNKEDHDGQIGKIKGHDGHTCYKVELKSEKETII